MARALIPLDVIASDVIADLRDSTGKHRFAITRHMLDCYRSSNIYMDREMSIKTVVSPVDNTVVMPDNFIYETKVGIRNTENGRIAILTLDPNIGFETVPVGDSAFEDYLNDVWYGDYSGSGFYFYNAFRGGNFLGELYGMGRSVRNAGAYNIDRRSGIIYIGSLIPKDAELVVEYQADETIDGLCLVPVEMKKMLEYYAKSEWYADYNITQSQINRNKYEMEYNKIKRLYNFRDALYMSAEVNKHYSPTNY